jgi:hypothetical protein
MIGLVMVIYWESLRKIFSLRGVIFANALSTKPVVGTESL